MRFDEILGSSNFSLPALLSAAFSQCGFTVQQTVFTWNSQIHNCMSSEKDGFEQENEVVAVQDQL